MERLNQHPTLTINQVAVKYGIDYTKLRDAQLQMLSNNLKGIIRCGMSGRMGGKLK